MTPFVHEFYVNLRTGAAYERAKKPLSQGNALADKIVVHVQDCGSDVDLSGMGVSALVVRFDGQTVPLTGTIEEGAACITLDKDSYAVPGEARVTVMLSAGEMVQTVLVLLLNVDTSQTSIVVDNGTIGDLTDLLAQITNMRDATADAREATQALQTVADSITEDAGENYWVSAEKEIFMLNQSADLAVFASFPTATSAKIWHEAAVNHASGIKLTLPAGKTFTMAFKITNGELSSLRFSPYRYTAGVENKVVNFVLGDDGFYSATFAPITETAYIHFTLMYNQGRPESNAVQIEDIRLYEGDSYEQTKKIRNEMLRGIGSESLSDDLIEKIGDPDNPCDYDGLNEISMFLKGVCIGDSLMAGVFNHIVDGANAGTTMRNRSVQSVLEKMTGVELTDLAVGGASAVTWYAAHSNQDLSGHDFAIVQLGVNDAITYSGWSDESETAFGNIVSKLKAENKGIKIFVSTIIPAHSYSGARYNSVSQGIRDFVEGLADNDVVLLDMAKYSHTGDSVAYNQGHLTAYGYARLAMDYKSYIGWYIRSHKADFANVQFIGTDYEYAI